jgi:hypothetical protein
MPDGSYVYICGRCSGVGYWRGRLCTDCYNLDLAPIRAELAGARGQRYYALLKAFLSLIGKDMVDEAKRVKVECGHITPPDVGYISLAFGLNFKATWEWLEETCVIRTSWSAFEDSGLKVRDVYRVAREHHPGIAEVAS